MQLSTFNPTQISNAVWAAAARTLTADPATDAGAATFVWTHAARTLTADPATDAGASTLVWTHATRSLVSAGFITLIHSVQTALAALTILDLRPAAGKHRTVAISAQNPGNAGAYAGVGLLEAGSTRQYMYAANAALTPQGTAGGIVAGDSVVGPMIYNGDPANPINYQYAGKDETV